MRSPISVNVTPFDIAKAQTKIEEIRDAFSRYLDHYVPKSFRSKHGLMGPVGKILSEAKRGRNDPEFLKGYVLRVHELAQKAPLSSDAAKALETGIDLLAKLLSEAPLTAHDRLIDRLDYGLYFARRKKTLEWIDERNRRYQGWLEQKYATLENMNQAWGGQIKAWDQIRFGGASSRIFKTASGQQREDMTKFGEYLKQVPDAGSIDTIDTEEEIA